MRMRPVTMEYDSEMEAVCCGVRPHECDWIQVRQLGRGVHSKKKMWGVAIRAPSCGGWLAACRPTKGKHARDLFHRLVAEVEGGEFWAASAQTGRVSKVRGMLSWRRHR